MTRTALVLGASGLIGRHCVDLLLEDAGYREVHTLVRSSQGRTHAKLREHVAPFSALASEIQKIGPQELFCCLGTTIKKAGSQDAFRQVDYEYPLRAAETASRVGLEHFLIVTALGASATSSVFYNRVKGEVERDLRKLGLPCLSIFRPSLLLGERAEERAGERIGAVVAKVVGPLLVGGLRKYRAIDGVAVARAMLRVAHEHKSGTRVLESDDIAALASLRAPG